MLSSLGWSTLFAMPKAAGMQLLVRFGTAPARYSLGTRGLLTTIRRGERALLIDELGDLSNDHIIASASLGSTIAVEVA
jgi:hypothetical protein